MYRLVRTILLVACISFCVGQIKGDIYQGIGYEHEYNDVNETVNSIEKPIGEESEFYRWFPWKKPQHRYAIGRQGEECVERPEGGSSIDEFPDDLFTQEQRLDGAVVLHFVGLIYFFTISGMVINYYFIPSVQCICNDLKITPDVGAAVFMATATATPEMFTNIISTFIAESDMGLGTIIGSLMFNILGVAAISSLANRNAVRMDWVPVTRDCVVFAINAIALVIIVWDERIFWYEAMVLLILSILYYILMFQSARISKFMKRKFEDEYRCCNRETFDLEEAIKKPSVYAAPANLRDLNDPHLARSSVYSITNSLNDEVLAAKKRQSITVHNHDFEIVEAMKRRSTINRNMFVNGDKKLSVARSVIAENEAESQVTEAEEKAELERQTYLALKKKRLGLWGWPSEDGWGRTIFWFYSWPIRVLLRCTMPNPKINRRFYPFTFLVCVVWIAVITYLLFWMLIIIGYTFSIPESVMGLTVFAIGGCTPEMITGIIMARRGTNGVGVANSLGASSLAILLSLGIPWLIKSILNIYNDELDRWWVELATNGIEFTALSLVLMIVLVYFTYWVRKFYLSKITGLILFIMYGFFITFAVLIELDILFKPFYCD